MNTEQLKNRIKNKMKDYVYANTGPYSRPRHKGLLNALPNTVPLDLIENKEGVESKEKAVLSLHAIKQMLNEKEQEVLSYRLMGYKISEIARMLMVAPKTVEGYLTRITRVCKEVNNA